HARRSTDGVRHHRGMAFSVGGAVPVFDSRTCLHRSSDHWIGILVNQESDATVRYQALVIRESATLFWKGKTGRGSVRIEPCRVLVPAIALLGNDLAAVASSQRLPDLEMDRVIDESRGAVAEADVQPAGVRAAEPLVAVLAGRRVARRPRRAGHVPGVV